MGECSYHVEEMNQGAFTFLADLAKAFEKVLLKVVLAWTMHIGFPHYSFWALRVSSTSE